MSASKNRHEASRWLDTAAEDLAASETLLGAGHYAQACFLAQQGGEKAIKALWRLMDADPWGHSIQRLLADFPQREQIPDIEAWTTLAALLDKYYIPTRYPNGLPDLTPGQVYGRDDADRGVNAARTLLAGAREWFEAH